MQAELLKTFDRHLADVKIHFAQNETVSAEKACQCLVENYDEFEKNRQHQIQLLQPNYLESFATKTEQKLVE